MNTYQVQHISEGKLDWSQVPGIDIACYQKKPELPVKAKAQMCWEDNMLHIRLMSTEPEILARYTGECDPVYQDSCLECFLCPKAEDGRYFNFEFNANGASFVGFGFGREDRIRLHPWNVKELLSVKTVVDGNYWEVNFDIPVDMINLFMPDFTLKKGRQMRANFYKCGDDVVPNHELTWNPITNGNDDFHQSEFFGNLILE